MSHDLAQGRLVEQLQLENAQLAATVQLLTQANNTLLEVVRQQESSNPRRNSDPRHVVQNQLRSLLEHAHKYEVVSSTGSSQESCSFPIYNRLELSAFKQEICGWINAFMGCELDPSLMELKNGVFLCQLLKTIDPQLYLGHIHLEATANDYFARDNLKCFFKGLQLLGVPEFQLAHLSDAVAQPLLDNWDQSALVYCLLRLSRTAFLKFGIPPPPIVKEELLLESGQESPVRDASMGRSSSCSWLKSVDEYKSPLSTDSEPFGFPTSASLPFREFSPARVNDNEFADSPLESHQSILQDSVVTHNRKVSHTRSASDSELHFMGAHAHGFCPYVAVVDDPIDEAVANLFHDKNVSVRPHRISEGRYSFTLMPSHESLATAPVRLFRGVLFAWHTSRWKELTSFMEQLTKTRVGRPRGELRQIIPTLPDDLQPLAAKMQDLDVQREFFFLTVLATKLNWSFTNTLSIQTEDMFKQACAEGVPFHQYPQWIQKHLMIEFIAQKYRPLSEKVESQDLRSRLRKMSRVTREVKFVPPKQTKPVISRDIDVQISTENL